MGWWHDQGIVDHGSGENKKQQSTKNDRQELKKGEMRVSSCRTWMLFTNAVKNAENHWQTNVQQPRSHVHVTLEREYSLLADRIIYNEAYIFML